MSAGVFRNFTNLAVDDFNQSYPSVVASLEGYRRRAVSHGGYPAITPCEGVQVKGILWSGVDDNTLKSLDTYEGCPSLYTREEVVVKDYKGVEHTCWVYVWARKEEDLQEQDWKRAEVLLKAFREDLI